MVQWNNSVGRATEQPVVSRDDWDTMVLYNENILLQNEQHNTTAACTELTRRPQERAAQPTELVSESNSVPRRVERPSFKPPKPPKPTSLQTIKRLLPVQQFLNRQVGYSIHRTIYNILRDVRLLSPPVRRGRGQVPPFF